MTEGGVTKCAAEQRCSSAFCGIPFRFAREQDVISAKCFLSRELCPGELYDKM